MPSPRDLFVRNILFYCFDDDGLGFITQLNYSSLLEVMFPSFLTSLSVFYEHSRNAKRVLLKPAREMLAPIERLGSTRTYESNMATDH